MADLPRFCVWTDDAADSDSSKLAARLRVPFVLSEEPPDEPRLWMFFYEDGALHLHSGEFPEFRPLAVDYLHGEFARRWKSATKNDILLKAIGIRNGVRSVLDASCGLGYDAFFLHSFKELEVTSCERAEPVAELVLDALSRVKEGGKYEARPIAFHLGDARDFLRGKERSFDAVYLDPMFPRDRSQSALPKRELQLLSALCGPGDPGEGEELFSLAEQAARKRVVVKRADDSGPITAARAPDFALRGNTVRFDVYLAK